MSRARFKIGDYELDVEGEESFVKAEIDRFQQMLATVPPKAKLDGMASNSNTPRESTEVAPAKTRRAGKRSGPSCADRVLALKTDDFFTQPKSMNEIGSKLREVATPYAANLLGATMTQLTKRRELRRFEQNGTFVYVNP